jgi:uncharacterized protein
MEGWMAEGRGDTSKRGFASMDQTRQREIARKGGESVPAEKRSFSQNHQLAAEAGRKGGLSSQGGRSAANRNAGRETASPRHGNEMAGAAAEQTSHAQSKDGMT